MSKPLRALIIEDSDADAKLMLRALRQTGYEAEWKRVEAESDYLAQLDQGWEIILADYSLPKFNAPQALKLLKKRGLDMPFIVVSGTIGEDKAVEIMKNGASDYVMKDKLAMLGSAIERQLR
ncbi:MAG: response regulator [Planctomycetes bacterium]|nr:response regulator [Planctomycetota bacterium]